MTSDDDKRGPDPDPWAGLDAGGADGAAEETTFSFEDFAEPAADVPPTGVEAGAAAADERAAADSRDFSAEDSVPRDVPLAVFPPVEAGDSDLDLERDLQDLLQDEPGTSAIDRDPGETSAVLAFSVEEVPEGGETPEESERAGESPWNAAHIEVENEVAAPRGDDLDADAFDDRRLAAELSAMDDDAETAALSDVADFGDLDADAGGPGNELAAESEGDTVASIPLTAAVAAASGQVAVSAGRPKKKASGLGTALGVVGGGLLALPVTYAILLWGLQKDPFKLGRHLPQAILPAAVRTGAKPVRKPTAAPVLDAAKSLDALPVVDAAPAPSAQAAVEPETATADAALGASVENAGEGSKPAMVAAATETAAPSPTDPGALPPADPAGPATVADAVPAPSIAPPADLIPPPDIAPPEAAVAMPREDALAGLDALVAKPANDLPATPSAEPIAPLDVGAVDDAAATVAEALDAIEAHPAADAVGRERLIVGWYRRLAALGEELVSLQTSAYDTGRPVEATPSSAAGLLDRIATSDRTLADVETLGGMWLTSATRRADGTSLVADVVATRQVGPYWSTKVLVPGGNADGSARELAVISRTPPPGDAAAGRVLVTGVLFDGGAIWAADIRPIAGMTAAAVEAAADPASATPDREADPFAAPPASVSPAAPEALAPETPAPADAGGGA